MIDEWRGEGVVLRIPCNTFIPFFKHLSLCASLGARIATTAVIIYRYLCNGFGYVYSQRTNTFKQSSSQNFPGIQVLKKL